MKLTRSQIAVVLILGILTIAVYGLLMSIIAINSPQISQLAAVAATVPPTDSADEPPSSPPATVTSDDIAVATATVAPAPSASPTLPPASTPTLAPTATPTPPPTLVSAAPQTRYDLQVMGDPNNAELRLQRGYAYIELDAHAYAIEDFSTALELDDTLTKAYLGRGEARFYLKEWNTSLEDFDQALAQNPELSDVLVWRGRLLSLLGRHEPAIEALRQAIALEDTSANHLMLADALLRSESFEEAKLAYTTVLSTEARSVEAYVGRAMTWAEEDNLNQALADLNSAKGISPHDPVVLNGRAWFHVWYEHRNLDEAEGLAQQAVSKAKQDLERAVYLHTLGWIYYEQERYEEAVNTLREAAALATVEGDVIYSDILEHLEKASEAQ
jgi:tetratricopeptide (TPR) repeat protein